MRHAGSRARGNARCVYRIRLENDEAVLTTRQRPGAETASAGRSSGLWAVQVPLTFRFGTVKVLQGRTADGGDEDGYARPAF